MEQLRWTDYINTTCVCATHTCVDYLLLESVRSSGIIRVTLLAENMFKQPATYVHTSKLMATYTVLRVWGPRAVFSLDSKGYQLHICTVCTSKLTATCIYTACFNSPSTVSNILTRVTYVCACTAELRSWTTTNSACHQWSTVSAVFKGVAAFSSAHYTQ